MNSFYRGTPYSLNKKLKNLHKFELRKKHDINILYKNLNDSIPDLTNSFCFLKNRTNALNKSLNKIPIIYSNFITSNSNYNSNSNSRIIRTSPNLSSNFNNYSYLSPKPVLKPYINTNKNNNIKFNIECFAGDNNSINLTKYICPICNCFFVEPLKCFGCSSNFCKECKGQQNCNLCNNNEFEKNDELIREMNENVKIKCDKCEEILDYQASLNHFH